jgi:hypothetical protein
MTDFSDRLAKVLSDPKNLEPSVLPAKGKIYNGTGKRWSKSQTFAGIAFIGAVFVRKAWISVFSRKVT